MIRNGTGNGQKGQAAQEHAVFSGEEGGDERSTPNKDFAAAIVIAVFALVAMVVATQWKVPDKISTSPGLLPFFTGLSLFAMAIGLALRAIRLGGGRQFKGAFLKGVRDYATDVENIRTLALFAIVFVYIVLVINVGFDWRYPIGAVVVRFSSFELFSILALTLIFKFFWREALLRCFVVATVWSIALASIFRYGFHILLPGSG